MFNFIVEPSLAIAGCLLRALWKLKAGSARLSFLRIGTGSEKPYCRLGRPSSVGRDRVMTQKWRHLPLDRSTLAMPTRVT